ncbi:MAG: class I SAM-dependent methyltransferase [Candidatus Hadarchaeota archaeon]|nr:class I SAM-dependent methyltransferase [Candidatus Hadarchaeota archaeon]
MTPEKKILRENIRLHKKEAELYEDSKAEIFNLQEQKRIDLVLQEALQYIETRNSKKRALDLGCGTGNLLEKLGALCDSVVGLDLSEDMLSVASSKNLKAESGLSLVRGRASKLPFPDNSFDLVTVYSVLHHLPHFPDPISEISRVLKKGGVLYMDHEPIHRGGFLTSFYQKTCNFLNQMYSSSDGFEENMDRQYCDYHIHHGDGGIPVSRVLDLCGQNEIKTIVTKKYLCHGSYVNNPLHSLLRHFITDEWMFIGKKER